MRGSEDNGREAAGDEYSTRNQELGTRNFASIPVAFCLLLVAMVTMSPKGCRGKGSDVAGSAASDDAGATGEFSTQDPADDSEGEPAPTGVENSAAPAYAGVPLCPPSERVGLAPWRMRYSIGPVRDSHRS